MMYDPFRDHRRSIRLEGYDYSTPGAYFVTVCVQDRRCLFGEIAGDLMQANDGGHMVGRWWVKLADKFPVVKPDEFIIMPNHFHGILFITQCDIPTVPVGAAPCGRPIAPRGRPIAPRGRPGPTTVRPDGGVTDDGRSCGDMTDGRPHGGMTDGRPHGGAPTDVQPTAVGLFGVMDWFKTMTTNEYIRGVRTQGWPPFPGRLWQRGYYERIIRDDSELARVREYIATNPTRWASDRNNPTAPRPPGDP